jgi:hypothetical protein
LIEKSIVKISFRIKRRGHIAEKNITSIVTPIVEGGGAQLLALTNLSWGWGVDPPRPHQATAT